jgi:hypothetical protein
MSFEGKNMKRGRRKMGKGKGRGVILREISRNRVKK